MKNAIGYLFVFTALSMGCNRTKADRPTLITDGGPDAPYVFEPETGCPNGEGRLVPIGTVIECGFGAACRLGEMTCYHDGWSPCIGAVFPTSSGCNCDDVVGKNRNVDKQPFKLNEGFNVRASQVCREGYTTIKDDPVSCDYACAKTNAGIDVIDDIDNDCNGIIDDVCPKK